MTYSITRLLRFFEKKLAGSDHYVIFGSQSDPEAEIHIKGRFCRMINQNDNYNGPVIELRNLRKRFGDHEVLSDINLKVNRGEVVSIIGSSGSGKSTMLRCINLLETPTSGEILYNGKNIQTEIDSIYRYRARVGMVFQQFNLYNNMNALENCIIGQVKVLKRSREVARQSL